MKRYGERRAAVCWAARMSVASTARVASVTTVQLVHQPTWSSTRTGHAARVFKTVVPFLPHVHACLSSLDHGHRHVSTRSHDAEASLTIASSSTAMETTHVAPTASTLSEVTPPVRDVRLRAARASRRAISQVKQEPLFPGMARHVSMFEGEHVYHYGLHTFSILRDSAALGMVPAGCFLEFILTHMFSTIVVPFEMQCVYLGCLLVLSRVLAAGKRNRCHKDLSRRHVVLTGGTSGLGKATAAQLAQMGADITLIGRDSPHAAAAVEYVRRHATGGADQRIAFEKLDLSDFIAVREYAKRARHRNQPIDVLVNAAGVLVQHHETTRFGDDVQLAVNFLGPYLLTEGLLPLVEAAHGRIVYVACSAHVGVRGNVVSTYLSGRGVWSPRVAHQFDGAEQYGFTKLGNIFHAQQLAIRSYPAERKSTTSSRRTPQQLQARTGARASSTLGCSGHAAPAAGGTPLQTSRGTASRSMDCEPTFTCCACSPGGVLTNLYRDLPLAKVLRYLYYPFTIIMRTAWEGSQTVVNCCVRDDFKNGGYYMNTRYQPAGLSKTACSVAERDQVMRWTHQKMKAYMKWD